MKRVSDYQVALATVLCLAESGERHIAPAAYYDDDEAVVSAIQNRCGQENTNCRRFSERLFRVCRKLCHIGIFYGETRGTHKEYFGEPQTQREYQWRDPSYGLRLASDYRYLPEMEPSPQREAEFLLRHFPGAPKRD